jgi:carbonic anhydrase
MDRLLAGVGRFQDEVFPLERELFAGLAHGQAPRALFVTCSDSRVLPNLITQTKPGELFICRVMGGIIPAHGYQGGVSATIEYAVAVLNVRHVIVCSHSNCGVLKVLLDPGQVDHLPSVRAWLVHAEAARRTVMENHADADDATKLALMTRYQVLSQLANLRTHPAVATRLARGDLGLHGWHYDIESGHVGVLDERDGSFVPVTELLGDLPVTDDATSPLAR